MDINNLVVGKHSLGASGAVEGIGLVVGNLEQDIGVLLVEVDIVQEGIAVRIQLEHYLGIIKDNLVVEFGDKLLVLGIIELKGIAVAGDILVELHKLLVEDNLEGMVANMRLEPTVDKRLELHLGAFGIAVGEGTFLAVILKIRQ